MWKKVLQGAAVAGAGAALTYLAEHLTQLNFGQWTPMVVAALSVLVNVVRKLLNAYL